jgi:hypothetical protein
MLVLTEVYADRALCRVVKRPYSDLPILEPAAMAE